MNNLETLTRMANPGSSGIDKLAAMAARKTPNKMDSLVKMASISKMGQLVKMAEPTTAMEKLAAMRKVANRFRGLIDVAQSIALGAGDRNMIKTLKNVDWTNSGTRRSILDYIRRGSTSKNYQGLMSIAQQKGLLDSYDGRKLFTDMYNNTYGGAHKVDDLFQSSGGIGGGRRFTDAASEDMNVYEFGGDSRLNRVPDGIVDSSGVPVRNQADQFGSVADQTSYARTVDNTQDASGGGVSGFMQRNKWAPYAAGGVGMMAVNNVGGRRGY